MTQLEYLKSKLIEEAGNAMMPLERLSIFLSNSYGIAGKNNRWNGLVRCLHQQILNIINSLNSSGLLEPINQFEKDEDPTITIVIIEPDEDTGNTIYTKETFNRDNGEETSQLITVSEAHKLLSTTGTKTIIRTTQDHRTLEAQASMELI